MIQNIIFSTSVGEYLIDNWNYGQSIREICLLNKIPYQSVTIYLRQDNKNQLFIGLDSLIYSIDSNFSEIVLYFDSNTNFQNVSNKEIIVKKKAKSVAEYSFPNSDSTSKINHVEFTQTDCKKYIQQDVDNFLNNFTKIQPNSKLVVGISGGGDSNALIDALKMSKSLATCEILPVMVRGIPGTDLGFERASRICENHNLKLIEINQEQVNNLLHRNFNNDWIKSFITIFPQSDIEIIATLGIRLSLFHIAQKYNATAAITGVNMEDLLAESFLRTMQGNLPLPFPIRVIGNNELWFPLYRTPKKIIDGCNPDFSLENYKERVPNAVAGRDIALYFTQLVHSKLNGIEFDFIEGMRKLSQKNTKPYYFDEKLDLYILEMLPLDVRHKWEQYLNNNNNQ